MIKFLLYSAVLINVFVIVLATDTETCDDDYSLTEESSYEEDESEVQDYSSSCTVYQPPIPATCKGDPNAYVSSCANNCPNQCIYLNKTDVPCPDYCEVNGCQCKKGYVLDDNTGKCVVPEQCSPATCKGDPNAYVSSCANNCPNQCKYLNKTNVPCPEYCQVNGCQCKKGYVLDDNTGKCVLPEQCSPATCKGDPNAYVSSCANNCPNQCRYLNRTNVPCPRNCQVDGCQCKKGYVLDDNTGKCVLPEQCSPTCGVNEVYSNCSNGLCQLQYCTQYGAPIPFCPRFDKTKCIGGCVCKSKNLRNPQGICVPQDECPSYLCLKTNHEVYSNCTNGGDQIRNCSQLGKPITCTNIDPADCIRGCICEEGYLRADDGTCIRKKDCAPKCGVNELYSNCSNGICQLKDCTQYGAPIPFCPRFDKTKCTGGCVCKSKHLRNPKGTCVPQDECPSYLCPKINHEVYSNCTNRGDQIRNCSQLGKPITCTNIDPADCIRGCICEEGYLRADDGTCIRKKDCQSCKGDPNAYVSNCANNCPNQCSYLNKTQYVCPAYCENGGCQCKKGFVFDDYTGKCVLPEQCTPTCGINEIYSNCSNGLCQLQDCTQYGAPIPFCPRFDKTKCTGGCVCKSKHLRNPQGICVPQDECPSYLCPKINHEIYSNCTNGGDQIRNCSQLGKPITCTNIDPADCIRGCLCEEGYLRADDGTCIRKNDCESCKGDPNAYVSNCANNCPNQCSYLNKTQYVCPAYCENGGCQCKKGFVFDDNTGKCVLPKQCTPTCGVSEVYSSCANCLCKYQYCTNYKDPVMICKPCNKNSCKGGCVCQNKFLRNPQGICVPQDECPSYLCPKAKHEVYSNCINEGCQPHNCSQVGLLIPCIKRDPTTCKKGCLCEEDYLRADDGTCIPAKECPIVCRGDNEVFSNCTNGGCAAKQCSELGYKMTCVDYNSDSCVKGCTCIDGYMRDDNGKCIPSDQCPSCGGDPNAQQGCGNCGRSCSDYMNTRHICPLRPCFINECQCRPDYVYDGNIGRCVLPKDCTPVCKADEVFSNCTNGGCDARNCSQLRYPVPCDKMDPACCKKGCICQPGFLRADNGTCIPSDQCPIVCKENEVYSNCTNGGCGAKECSQLGYKIDCVDYNSDSCVKGCGCIDGYVRDENGKCIPSNQCPSCGGDPNAEPGCSINCGRHCSNYMIKNPICPLRPCYINDCQCRPDYVMDDNIERCVLPKDCTPTCKEHEVFSNCTNGDCNPRECSQLGYPVPCPKIDPASCKKGCTCQPGYLRAKNGTCIPSDQCPSCGGDPNAQPGCGINCGRHCSNYKNKHPICPRIACVRNRCDCKKDYVYDDNLKKCVLPEDCTPTCELNEVFSNCYNGGCVARNCSQKDSFKHIQCSPINPKACKKGCICKEKYLRAKNGTCIPEDQCQADSDGEVTNCTEALQRLYDGITMFTGNFFSVVVKKNIGKSVVISPFSVIMVIANLAFGVKNGGNSYNQLMSVLNLESKNEIRCSFLELIRSFKSQNESELDVAENVYVNKIETLKQQFRNDTEVVLGGEAENIDFSDANQAADTINKRIEQQTRNRIKNLVSPTMLSSQTILVITNAIYFLGAWVKQFDPKQTRKGDFFVSDTQSVQKDFMYRKGSFKYADIPSLDAKCLQIPYKGENFTYVACLPNAIDGTVNLVEKLREPATLNGAIQQLSYKMVAISLPRNEIQSTIDLTPVFKELGLTDIFDANKSDLVEIIESKEKLAVSSAVHKAYCKVDEVGTEAAAATAVIIGPTAVQQSNVFNANHPFVFYVCLHDIPVFCGVVSGDSN